MKQAPLIPWPPRNCFWDRSQWHLEACAPGLPQVQPLIAHPCSPYVHSQSPLEGWSSIRWVRQWNRVLIRLPSFCLRNRISKINSGLQISEEPRFCDVWVRDVPRPFFAKLVLSPKYSSGLSASSVPTFITGDKAKINPKP